MRKLLISSAVLLGLAGCITVGPGGISTTDPRIQPVIDGARSVCGFVPTAETILELFEVGVGGISEAVNVICRVITGPQRFNRAGRPIVKMYRGVRIRGQFIK